MANVACPKCQTRYRVPSSALGKKAKCTRCGATFVADQATTPSTADVIRVRCTGCGAAIKVPASAAGRRAKCPKCDTVLRIPRPAGAPEKSDPTPAGGGNDLLDDFIAIEKAAPATPAPPILPSPPEGGGPICPSCGRSLPPAARICVDCGINVKTGRSLIITQDENLDNIYTAAERTIRLISWIIWFGLYPIASEAFGLYKPYVTRAIALITIVTSVAFFTYLWSDSPPVDSLTNLMLWCGDPDVKPDLAAMLRRWGYEEEDEEMAEALRELSAELAEGGLTLHGEFRPAQLITHAFLHADILHLAGNLLFLMVLGSRVNALIGNLWTLGLYPLFAIAAAVAQMLASAHDPAYPMIGASGAIMGMAGMYLVFFPVHKVHMAFWWRWLIVRLTLKSFAVRGFWVVLFYIAFDVLYTALGVDTGVAHWAHLGGFIAGVIVALVLLITRQVNAHGGDLFSVILGRRAWAIIGRPHS